MYKNCDRHNFSLADSAKLARYLLKMSDFGVKTPKNILWSYAYRQSCTGEGAGVMHIVNLVQSTTKRSAKKSGALKKPGATIKKSLLTAKRMQRF